MWVYLDSIIWICYNLHNHSWASQVALVVKNLPANAGDIRDVDLIPGLGKALSLRSNLPGVTLQLCHLTLSDPI